MSFFKDKRVVGSLAGLIVFVLIAFYGIHYLSSAKRELTMLREQRNEMLRMKDEYLALKQQTDSVEGRKNLSGPQGIVQAMDEVFQFMGLKDKIKTLKSTGKKEVKGGFQEDADLSIEKVTMNEMVNILYRIENAPMVLTMKKITIKKSFENPELLNISLVLSFLKTK
jgi:general secretion pathway protein M